MVPDSMLKVLAFILAFAPVIATAANPGSQVEPVTTEKEQLERRTEELERAKEELERAKAVYDDATRAITREQERLEQRIEELEAAQTAQEDATRAIIKESVSTLGSKINEFVTFGGALEVLAGRVKDFKGQAESVLVLNTAELDFEIQANDWAVGRLIIEYDAGTNVLFTTNEGSELAIDRFLINTASITIGNPQRFPPFGTFGRMTVPFGISTGDPVADVLTIEDPLTIEVFETREDAILLGAAFPTPAPTPAAPPVTPPPVKPLVINPFGKWLGRALGYKPPPKRPPPPTPFTPMPAPPLFNAGIYFYNGDTFKVVDRGFKFREHFGATVGFRTKGDCGRPYEQRGADGRRRWPKFPCPWSIDVDVDYNNSVFDSDFLESEYRSFLGQIGFVRGMAASVKATLGAVSLVGEWNGAVEHAKFIDDVGNLVSIKPSAWQIALGYQFDWNPWVENIGDQGTFLTIGYSKSHDLAGVTRLIAGELTRVGFVPKKRFLVGAGEWVSDNVLLSVEYSRIVDYSKSKRGTGRSAKGIFMQLTLVW